MRSNLRFAIKERFGSQLACAKACSIHGVRLNRICCGWVDPTPVERERLAVVLNADSSWLFAVVTHIPARNVTVEVGMSQRQIIGGS